MTENRLAPASGDIGRRLDAWLADRLADLTRSRIQALIRSGDIRVDGRIVRPHTKVTGGITVTVQIPSPVETELRPEAIPLDVLHEDRDIIVVNKAAGLVVHPAPGHAAGTLVNALLHHCTDLAGVGGELRPGIVHRLDKDTSGAMVAAKNDQAHEGLAAQFKEGKVRKEYLALVKGVPDPRKGTIETPIGRSHHDRKKMSARPRRGKPAISRYTVEETFGDASLVRVVIETGRTHQIRVHLAHIGHPVLGDRQYGGRQGSAIPRQMLHAHVLGLKHPATGKGMMFTAPVPEDITGILSVLRDQGPRTTDQGPLPGA